MYYSGKRLPRPFIMIGHPELQKIGSPPPPTVRSVKKLFGPINFKTGRSDLSYSSIPACVSTGVSGERLWSVRSNSKSIGPIDFNIGRGDPPHTRIKGSPPSPTLHSAEKEVGPTDCKRDRPGPVHMREGGLCFQKISGPAVTARAVLLLRPLPCV